MRVDRINKGSWGKIRAFFDVMTEEGFTLKGFKLVDGINGLFVGFPSQKGSDDEYRDTIWADKELKDSLTKIAISAYENGINQEPEYSNAEQSELEDEFSAEVSDEDIPF